MNIAYNKNLHDAGPLFERVKNLGAFFYLIIGTYLWLFQVLWSKHSASGRNYSQHDNVSFFSQVSICHFPHVSLKPNIEKSFALDVNNATHLFIFSFSV